VTRASFSSPPPANGPPAINIDAQPLYPAAYQIDNIVFRRLHDPNDSLGPLSNYGATNVDLAAPGEQIYSTFSSSDTAYFPPAFINHRGHFVRGCHDVGAFCLNARQVPGGNPSGDHRPGARRNRSLACPRRQMRHRRPAQPAERAQPANSANAALQPRQRTVPSCACPAAPARTCIIQRSSTLTNWVFGVHQYHLTNGTFDYTDTHFHERPAPLLSRRLRAVNNSGSGQHDEAVKIFARALRCPHPPPGCHRCPAAENVSALQDGSFRSSFELDLVRLTGQRAEQEGNTVPTGLTAPSSGGDKTVTTNVTAALKGGAPLSVTRIAILLLALNRDVRRGPGEYTRCGRDARARAGAGGSRLKANDCGGLSAIRRVCRQAECLARIIIVPLICAGFGKPAQSLAFSLDPPAPAGASISPATGVFTWTATNVRFRPATVLRFGSPITERRP